MNTLTYELLNRLPLPIYCRAPDNTIAYANGAFAALLGYSDGNELKGLTVAEIFPNATMPLEPKAGTIDTTVRRFQIHRPDGRLLHLLEAAYAVTINDQRSPEVALCVLHQIPECDPEAHLIAQRCSVFRTILDQVDLAFWEVDDAGTIVDMNLAARKLTGYSEKEIEGHPNIGEIFASGEAKHHQKHMRDLLKGRTVPSNAKTCNIRSRAGHDYQVCVIDYAFGGAAGKKGYPGVITTAREERILEDIAAFLRSQGPKSVILNEWGVSSFVKMEKGRDKDGEPIIVFEYVNLSYAADVQMTRDDIIGKTEFEVFPAEIARSYYHDDRKVIEERCTISKIERHPQRIGDTKNEARLVQVLKVPLLDPSNREKAIGVQGYFWYLDQISVFERLLRHTTELNRSILENLPLNVFRKDMDRKCTYASPEYCKLMGCELSDILNRTDEELHRGKPVELLNKYKDDDNRVLLLGETVVDIEEHLPGNDSGGIAKKVYVIKTPIRDKNGEIVGLQGVFWFKHDLEQLIQEYRKRVMEASDQHEVFISYAKEDRKYLEGAKDAVGLLPYLEALEGTHQVRSWYDKHLKGARFNTVIPEKIRAAKVAVLLLSPFYFSPAGYLLEKELGWLLNQADRDELTLFLVLASKTALDSPTNTLVQRLREHPFEHIDKPLDEMTDSEQRQTWFGLCDKIRLTLRERVRGT